jgi:hypothetical protein
MKKLLLLAIALPFYSFGKITPEIAIPDGFSDLSFYSKTVGQYDYLADTSGCGNVSFKLFYPPEHNKYPPSGQTPWLCLYSVDVRRDGYVAGDLLPEKIYFDKKSEQWKKKRNTLDKEDTRDALKVYGVKSMHELKPVELYNIQSVNAHGYAVVDNNIPQEDQRKGIKKILSFCLIQNQSYFAFCGSRTMITQIDGKDVDFTLYMLKSLETVEIGLPENPTK